MPLTLLTHQEIGRRVQGCREEVGVSATDLAMRLGIAEASIEELEQGRSAAPSGDLILAISRILQVDFRYLISTSVDAEAEGTLKIYRKLSEPTPSDKMAIRRFMGFASAERDLQRILSTPGIPLPPTPLLRKKLSKDQGVEAARSERARLGLGLQPIHNIFELIRAQGVLLFRHSLVDSGLSGLTVVNAAVGTAILVNYVDDLYRQFFSAAHEYAHSLLDRSALQRDGCVVSYSRFSGADLAELRANNFAAELLFPRDSITPDIRRRLATEPYSIVADLARRYRVNVEVVVRTLQSEQAISDAMADSILGDVKIRKIEKTDPEIPANSTVAQVQRRVIALKEGLSASYIDALRSALVRQEITWGRAADLLAMSTSEVQRFFADVGAAV